MLRSWYSRWRFNECNRCIETPCVFVECSHARFNCYRCPRCSQTQQIQLSIGQCFCKFEHECDWGKGFFYHEHIKLYKFKSSESGFHFYLRLSILLFPVSCNFYSSYYPKTTFASMNLDLGSGLLDFRGLKLLSSSELYGASS